MTSGATRSAIVTLVALAAFGCNALLDNREGRLVADDEAGALPAPGDDGGPGVEDAAVSGTDAGGDANVPSPDGCPGGEHLCNGVCVSVSDAVYGCGDPACAPCPGAHAALGCQAGACAVTACDPGYSNCNGASADGCETDLSKPETCGACNATCAAATPLCAAVGAGFSCTNGCTPMAPVNCGNACVDPNTNVDNCGACNVKCPVIANGTTSCSAGACGFACKAAFRECRGACTAKTDPTACGAACAVCPVPPGGVATCVADACGISCTAPNHQCAGACVPNDVLACGAACTPCAAPPNATATCAAGACGFTCHAGFADCDGLAANGCEVDLTSDNANCGMCGKACLLLLHCSAGACKLLGP